MNKVCVIVGEGFEEVEALTVVDILRRNDIDVELVSITKDLIVTGAHNIKVFADQLFEDINFDEVEMIVLPGGMPGTENLRNHTGLKGRLILFATFKKKIAAICAAPSILGRVGILQGRKAVCFPGYEDDLLGAEIVDEPVVIDHNIITSRSMETSLMFANSIVEELKK